MSTRCNIIIRDDNCRQFILYRHCDGYKEETFEHLKKFIKTSNYYSAAHLVNNLIRLNLGDGYFPYEITDSIHGDIEYLYIIDLKSKYIRVENFGINENNSVCETFYYNKEQQNEQ